MNFPRYLVMYYYYYGETNSMTTFLLTFPGDPLHVGMDLTIASFDAISEVNMVSLFKLAICIHLYLHLQPTALYCRITQLQCI